MTFGCSAPGRAAVGLWMGTLIALGSPGQAHAGLNQWTIGGSAGVFIDALASDPLSPRTVYAGSTAIGMIKTTGGGDSWVLANAGLTNLVIRAIALTPQVPTTLYAGTTGGGVFKSTNGGATWEPASTGLTNTVVTALAADPQTPTIIFAGTNGSGVFKSTNGGASWGPVNAGLLNTVVASLAIAQQSPATLYVGTTGSGVFKSTNGGTTWFPVNGGLLNTFVVALAVDPQAPSRVYAGTNSGVFKSTDGGGSWRLVNDGLVNTIVTALAINPQTPTTLYAGTTGGGVFTSTNAGTSWAPLNAGLADTVVGALAVSLTGTCLHAGTSSGVFDLATGDEACSPSPLVLPSRLVNISTRALVETVDDVMIGGFIIAGSVSKTVLVRARGPSLASFGVIGVLANPFLRIFSGQTAIAENDDWQITLPLCQASGHACGNPSSIAATGLGPSQPQESAILITLAPGPYTAVVSGAGGTTGVGIVEAFEVGGPSTTSRLVNISTRGLAEVGDEVMIGGFVIGGTLPMRVLIRAGGPSLANLGVPGALAKPFLRIFAGQTPIAGNDNWQAALPLCQATGHTCGSPSEIAATGLAPSDAQESALLITLTPGPYTAIVSGVGDTTGVGIVEVFEVQ